MAVRKVPGTYPTIQDALGKARAGDTILVDIPLPSDTFHSYDVRVENLTITSNQAGYLGLLRAYDTVFVTVAGNASAEFQGGSVGNVFTGGNANDFFDGWRGDDVLNGGAGNDEFNGGAGNDTIDGGDGLDLITYPWNPDSGGGIAADLRAGVVHDNTGGIDIVTNVEQAVGTPYADVIRLGNGPRVPFSSIPLSPLAINKSMLQNIGLSAAVGDAANDRLVGGSGVDYLEGGAGNDILDGGAGSDFASYVTNGVPFRGAVVDLATGQANDTSGNTDSLTNIENVYGSGNDDKFTGNAGSNYLIGWLGNDSLLGGAGDDWLSGGFGNDTLNGGGGIDLAIFANETADIVLQLKRSSAAIVTIGGVARDTIVDVENVVGGSGNDKLTGDSLANRLESGDGVDVLSGGTGDDALVGGAGDDRLDGGTGADAMTGGTGDDSYVVDSARDRVIEAKDEGSDLVTSSVSFKLGENCENLTLMGTSGIAGTGNALANILIGNAGANLLDGKTGADTMQGGFGDDRYVVDNVGDQVIEVGGQGVDLVTSSVSFALVIGIENLTLEGAETISGTGTGAANVIIGNRGDNRLDGLGGDDRLTGGLGRDTFVFNTPPGGGNVDTVRDFVSGTDRFELKRSMFAGLDPGALSAAAFVQASAAVTADQHIIYNMTRGVLSYDPDGSGSRDAIVFARLIPGQAVTAGDFTVV